MKKGTIIALIIAAVLIVAGGVLLVLGLSFAGDSVVTVAPAEKNYVVDAPFESIRVETATCNVDFQKADGSFKVSCPDSEKFSYTVTVEENTLCVRQVDLRQWYDFIDIHLNEEKITVYLPKETYDTLYIETDTGDISLLDSFTFTSATLLSDTGDVGFAAQVTEELSVTTDTGDIRVRGSAPESLTLSINTGRIRVEDVSCGELTCESNTGEVKLKNVLSTGAIQLQTDTGDITIENCDAESANILSDTGDIFGNFLTSKWFQATSDTGRVSVPKTREGGLCQIVTNTGDITFS